MPFGQSLPGEPQGFAQTHLGKRTHQDLDAWKRDFTGRKLGAYFYFRAVGMKASRLASPWPSHSAANR